MALEPIKSLIYRSRVAEPLGDAAVYALYKRSMELNALDGITGVLIYDGERFVQLVEGAPQAIDALVERLERDPRHVEFEIVETGESMTRVCPRWTMQLVKIQRAHFEARRTLEEALARIDDPFTRQRLIEATFVDA